MVVWLKPCKSRSSPGSFYRTPASNEAGVFIASSLHGACNRSSPGSFYRTPASNEAGVFYCFIPCMAHATGHRQGLFTERQLPTKLAFFIASSLAWRMQQVIARVFLPNASFQRSWRFLLLHPLHGACNRSSPGSFYRTPASNEAGVFYCFIPCMAHATGHRQGLFTERQLPTKLAFFIGAPGRAHLLGGGSPLLARQGEELAERQGCPGRLGIWRKPKAKRWPDEQEADTRRHGGVRWPILLKPKTCTERRDVDPTGTSVKVGASYPGRSAWMPRAIAVLLASRGAGRSMQKSAEAIVGVGANRRAEH